MKQKYYYKRFDTLDKLIMWLNVNGFNIKILGFMGLGDYHNEYFVLIYTIGGTYKNETNKNY